MIRNVLVYGNGIMGSAVAKTFAAAGFNTLLKSRRAASPEQPLQPVRVINTLPDTPPDLVIEFVPEDLAIKRMVLAEVQNTYRGANFILATGTSGLDLVELAKGLPQPANLIGIHYFMPADRTTIVEVMAGPLSTRETVDRAAEAIQQTGKEPLRIYRPIVGFLINRLQHAILHEAYYLLESGVTSVEAIDLGARRLLGPRMCLNGLLRQKDLSGLGIHAAAQKAIVPTLHHNRTPCSLLQNMVEKGETGIDAGRGFYDWRGSSTEALRRRTSDQLEKLMSFLDEHL